MDEDSSGELQFPEAPHKSESPHEGHAVICDYNVEPSKIAFHFLDGLPAIRRAFSVKALALQDVH